MPGSEQFPNRRAIFTPQSEAGERFHPFSSPRFTKTWLALAVILLPLNSRLPYFGGIFGELSGDAAFYPLAIGVAIWGIELLYGQQVLLSKHFSVRLLAILLLWIIVSVVCNLPWIVVGEIKGRTGAEKAVLQVLVLAFTVLTAFFVYSIAARQVEPLRMFRRWILCSFLFAGTFSLLELASYLGISQATAALAAGNRIIHPGDELYFGRLRSLSGEASWFAMYCSVAFPWVLSYVFTERRRTPLYLGLVVYLILLIVLSWSRTAYVITTIQVLLFLTILAGTSDARVTKTRFLALTATAAVVVFLGLLALRHVLSTSFSPADVFASLLSRDNASNTARFGAQVAAYRTAMDHPVLGVGLGQYGFYMRNHVPTWAAVNDEIRVWMSVQSDTPWPTVHSLYARIAAEAGFVGLGLWIAIWLALLVGCWRQFNCVSRAAGKPDVLGLALVVTIVGLVLSGLNMDSFRFFAYWIIMGLSWRYLVRRQSNP